MDSIATTRGDAGQPDKQALPTRRRRAQRSGRVCAVDLAMTVRIHDFAKSMQPDMFKVGSSPQARGWIERSHGPHQDRLVKTLRPSS